MLKGSLSQRQGQSKKDMASFNLSFHHGGSALSLHPSFLAYSLSLSLPLPLLSYHIANVYNNPLTLNCDKERLGYVRNLGSLSRNQT